MAQCPHCNKKIDKDNVLIQESKEDYWLCSCGDYHKDFPYTCPRKRPIVGRPIFDNKGQVGTAWIILLIGLLLIAFIMAVPPDYRLLILG